jgi:hypothetical protein
MPLGVGAAGELNGRPRRRIDHAYHAAGGEGDWRELITAIVMEQDINLDASGRSEQNSRPVRLTFTVIAARQRESCPRRMRNGWSIANLGSDFTMTRTAGARQPGSTICLGDELM